MKIGSHNTMTYLKPKYWLLRLFNFVAKCQKRTYQEQFAKGARWFDLRIKTSKDITDEPTIAHGLMEYKTYNGFIEDFLLFLNAKAEENPSDPIYVRILYEMPNNDKSKNTDLKEQNFIDLCKHYQKKYKHVHFIGGQRKYDWKTLVDLEPYPCSQDFYASYTWKKWDDWCPWFYAFFMNKKNIKKYKDVNKDCFMLIDFI